MSRIFINAESIKNSRVGRSPINSDTLREFMQEMDAEESISSVDIYSKGDFYSKEGLHHLSGAKWERAILLDIEEYNDLIVRRPIINPGSRRGFRVVDKINVDISYEIGANSRESIALLTGDYYLKDLLIKRASSSSSGQIYLIAPREASYSVYIPSEREFDCIEKLSLRDVGEFIG